MRPSPPSPPQRPPGPDPSTAAALAEVHSAEWGRIVATLIRITGDWALAEDCTQDAFAVAVDRWGRDGIPDNPGGWLTTVAKNRAVDTLRRASTEASKLRDLVILSELEHIEREEIQDDRLRLIFTCCHPALSLEARVALTLRTVAGLTVAEIARAFLVPETTMARRLVRARTKIRTAGIPYAVPPASMLPERLPGVLAVLYLLFNEGYFATSGDEVVREPLAVEAIRVTRLVASFLPAEPEVAGLLALMLLQHARRAARTDTAGDVVTLENQDRSLWDAAAISEAGAVLDAAGRHPAGPYRLQAYIARAHAVAPSWDTTDFASIVQAYDELAGLDASPVIALNRAIAIGMSDGPAAGLGAVDRVAAQLGDHHLVPAARADFLRRLGRKPDAAVEYRAAIALAPTDTERRYLEARLREVLEAD